MRAADVLVVGTGHAGAQVAIGLRQQGFGGSILMIGRESEPPYERPPLSKEYLAGKKAIERIYIRPPQFWSEKNIGLLLNSTVDRIDPHAKIVQLCDGASLRYGSLVWAAGGDARTLPCPGAGLDGVHVLRDKADADGIAADLAAGSQKIVIIGGGYIGLEAAAIMAELGRTVVLLEAQSRVLARVAGEAVSRFYEAEHRSHGVEVRLGAVVDRIEGADGRVRAVHLGDGEKLNCDLVIVGVGIDPVVAPLARAGAKIENGVLVDEYCRTSLPDIYAIGDCACHFNKFARGEKIRLESVQNANDMARTVSAFLCGESKPYCATPWFWSNQYDLKLQTVGLSGGFDNAIVRGSPADKKFSVFYMKGDRIIAVDCINSVGDFVQGRILLERAGAIDVAKLGDPRTSLKDL